MAIVPGATSTGGNAAATSTVVNKPSGVTDGSVLVVGITVNNSATVTPPAGWVEIGSPQTFTGAQGNLFLKVIADAGSEPSTYTFTLSASQSSNNACQEFSGVDNASPLGSDVGVFNSSSLVTSLPMSSVTVELDGSLLVSNCSVNSSSRTFTAPSGWDTALEVTGFQAVALSWRAVDAGATGTQSWTIDSSAESAAQMVALRPAASAAVSFVGSNAVYSGESLVTDAAVATVTTPSGTTGDRLVGFGQAYSSSTTTSDGLVGESAFLADFTLANETEFTGSYAANDHVNYIAALDRLTDGSEDGTYGIQVDAKHPSNSYTYGTFGFLLRLSASQLQTTAGGVYESGGLGGNSTVPAHTVDTNGSMAVVLISGFEDAVDTSVLEGDGWTIRESLDSDFVVLATKPVDAGSVSALTVNAEPGIHAASLMIFEPTGVTTAPTDPTSVVATTADSEATVTWVDGSGSPEPTWDVEYRVDAGSWTTSASDLAQGVQTRTQTGLTNGTTVRFRVRGQNTAGDSAWVESNDVTVGSTPLEILDATSSGNNTAAGTQNVAYPAHSVGDLIVQSISIDANVTATVPTTGPNGETITAITTNVNPGTAGPRFSAWWWIATGAETAGNISVTLSAAEQTSSESFRVPAGSFDPADPIPDISANGTQTSGTGTTITMPSFTATVAGGLVVAMGGVDADPMDATFSPAGWTDVITHDQGSTSSFVAQRDALTTTSETIAAASFGINTGDTASVVGFVIAPAPSGGPATVDLAATPAAELTTTSAATRRAMLEAAPAAELTVNSDFTPTAQLAATPSGELNITSGATRVAGLAGAPAAELTSSSAAQRVATLEAAPAGELTTTSDFATSTPGTVVSARHGGLTGTGVQVNCELSGADNPILLVSTNSDLSSPVATAPGSQYASTDWWNFSVTGLTAGTAYFAGFGSTPVAEFTTHAAGAEDYLTLLGSCYEETSTIAFSRMQARKVAAGLPAQFITMGDWPYIDNPASNEDVDAYLGPWSSVYGTSIINTLLYDASISYTPSDHDWGENNSYGAIATADEFHEAYRASHPSYPLPDAANVYHTWVRGRVRWIMLDVMSNRGNEAVGSDATRPMLGATQLAWLIDLIENATEPAIVINVSEAWIIDGESNGWDLAQGEREDIANAIQARGAARFVIVHGDAHELAWDDGSNSNYATTPVGNGPPVFCMAPFDRANSTKGGPYSEGEWASNPRQYGSILVTDDGDIVTLTIEGYSVTSSTTEIQRFTTDIEFSDGVQLGAAPSAALTTTSDAARVVTLAGAPAAELTSSSAAQRTATLEAAPAGELTTTLDAQRRAMLAGAPAAELTVLSDFSPTVQLAAAPGAGLNTTSDAARVATLAGAPAAELTATLDAQRRAMLAGAPGAGLNTTSDAARVVTLAGAPAAELTVLSDFSPTTQLAAAPSAALTVTSDATRVATLAGAPAAELTSSSTAQRTAILEAAPAAELTTLSEGARRATLAASPAAELTTFSDFSGLGIVDLQGSPTAELTATSAAQRAATLVAAPNAGLATTSTALRVATLGGSPAAELTSSSTAIRTAIFAATPAAELTTALDALRVVTLAGAPAAELTSALDALRVAMLAGAPAAELTVLSDANTNGAVSLAAAPSATLTATVDATRLATLAGAPAAELTALSDALRTATLAAAPAAELTTLSAALGITPLAAAPAASLRVTSDALAVVVLAGAPVAELTTGSDAAIVVVLRAAPDGQLATTSDFTRRVLLAGAPSAELTTTSSFNRVLPYTIGARVDVLVGRVTTTSDGLIIQSLTGQVVSRLRVDVAPSSRIRIAVQEPTLSRSS